MESRRINARAKDDFAMRYELIEGERPFLDFEPDYRALYAAARARNPFSSPDWIYTWYAHHRDYGAPCVIAIYSDLGQHLLGAFALIRTPRGYGRSRAEKIAPMAHDSADYLEPLARDAHDDIAYPLASALGRLMNKYRCELFISQLPETRARPLCEALTRHDIHYVEKPASLCPYARITGAFAEFMEQRFSAKTRQTLRRKWRRLGDHGELSVKVGRVDHDLDGLLSAIARIEARGWKGDKKVGLFSSRRARAFHTEALKRLAIQGQARITVLTLAGDPIAYEIGLLSGDRYMMYGTGYLPAYRQYSPGAQLMLKNIEYAFDAGFAIYDFMRGDEDYKRQWATHTTRNRAVSAFDSGIKGWLGFRALQSYTNLRGVARRFVNSRPEVAARERGSSSDYKLGADV